MIFRDSERGNRVSVAVCADLEGGVWSVSDLTKESVGMWESTYDPVVWNKKKELQRRRCLVAIMGANLSFRQETFPLATNRKLEVTLGPRGGFVLIVN